VIMFHQRTPDIDIVMTNEAYKERYNREAKNSGSKVGTGLNDGWLWVKTRFDLAAVDITASGVAIVRKVVVTNFAAQGQFQINAGELDIFGN